MKKRAIWVLLTCFTVISLLLASCAKSTTTSTPTATTTSTTSISNTTTSSATTSTTPTTTTVATTTTATGHWWDYLGTPQYGGTLISRASISPTTWDPYNGTSGTIGATGLQGLVQADYTLDPSVWDISKVGFPAPQYYIGLLALNWETPNAYTYIFHLRQDVYWWNIAPANGRQFTSADVIYHWNRALGLGGGFTTPSPWFAGQAGYKPLLSVVANDKFTVTFNFVQGTNPYSILNQFMSSNFDRCYENPESVALYGNLNDWHHALGTGPYMTTDYVSDQSITQTANPNYWESDLRYPGYKFPYVKTRTTLIIPNNATAEAAMRVGKIDSYPSMPVQDALSMQKSNPEIVVKTTYPRNELTIDANLLNKPFSDINVRIAMQHAIDTHLIASTIYSGYADPDPAGICQNQMTQYPFYPYTDWPQSLKDEYTYNPTLAKQMLASAGYPNGFNTNIILENDCNMDLWLAVQSQLAAVGINMSITTMDPASWQALIITKKTYDALCARPQGQTGQATTPLTMIILCTTGHMIDYININNPQIDAWYAQANAAPTIDAMYQIANTFFKYYPTQHYATSLIEPLLFNLVQPWVGGGASQSLVGVKTDGEGGRGDGCWINQDIKHSYGH